MHLKNRVSVKLPQKQRHVAPHYQDETNRSEQRGLDATVRFFVDHIIGVAVASVARKQAHTARITVTGNSGSVMHVLISTLGEKDAMSFVAYTNDMCLFVGSAPSLYVVDQTPRGIEHSIYLYMSEKLKGESSIAAQIFRESTSLFELPVLEGNSDEGLNSIKPRAAAATG
jgi:hypothetical protein